MNREEYDRRKYDLRKRYMEDLLRLEREWLQEFPAEVFDPPPLKVDSYTRVAEAVDSLNAKFTINDVQRVDLEIYPEQKRLPNTFVGRTLSELQFKEIVELVHYNPSGQNTWQRIARVRELEGK